MSDLEHQIDRIVAPLGAISPATRGTGRPSRAGTRSWASRSPSSWPRSRWAPHGRCSTRPRHRAGPASPGQPLACHGIPGGTAAHAQQVAEAAGYTIEWRFEVWNSDGRSSNEVPNATIAPDDVVELAALGTGGQLVILVHAADDPNAPPVAPESGCPSP